MFFSIFFFLGIERVFEVCDFTYTKFQLIHGNLFMFLLHLDMVVWNYNLYYVI
jgi:hypothetical protein